MDYGLWLLVGLLVGIALVFLLSGKRKADDAVEPGASAEPDTPNPAAVRPAPVPPAPVPPAPVPVVDPIVAAPVTAAPPAAEPVPVTAPAAEPVVESPAPTPAAQPAPPAAAPEPVATPTPLSSPVAGDTDDLLRLKGVGPKLKTLLIELGVTRYAQIAAWTDADIAAIDAKLGNFKGRPVRDQWVDQAKYLAAGDIAGFEAKYGKI